MRPNTGSPSQDVLEDAGKTIQARSEKISKLTVLHEISGRPVRADARMARDVVLPACDLPGKCCLSLCNVLEFLFSFYDVVPARLERLE